LVHIPNEGKRSPRSGKKLKDVGLRAGFPDFFMLNLDLFIEMKTPEYRDKMPKLPIEQEEYRQLINSMPNKFYVVCYSAQEAMRMVEFFDTHKSYEARLQAVKALKQPLGYDVDKERIRLNLKKRSWNLGK